MAGLVFGLVSFLAEPLFLRDYWHPGYLKPLFVGGYQIGSLEDFLYGFLKGGIASVIYEEIFGKFLAKRKNRKHHWVWFLAPFYMGGVALFIVPIYLLNLNSLYAALLASLFCFSFYVWLRKDLLFDSLMSGILVGALSIVGLWILTLIFPEMFHLYWKLHNLSGIFVAGVPVEELLESFAVGMIGGPFYEFFMGRRFLKTQKNG